MPRFPDTLKARNPSDRESNLKRELEGLKSGVLPLHLCTSQGGLAGDGRIAVTVFELADGVHAIRAQVGVFFDEIVGGCSCGDDPFIEPAYCRLQVTIDKASAEASFDLIE